jgi:hypothetical protein
MSRDYKTKIITSPDGIKRTIFDNKLHSWEGPALVFPKDMKKKDEYYLYGMQYTKDEWLEQKRDTNGVPPSHNGQVTTIK